MICHPKPDQYKIKLIDFGLSMTEQDLKLSTKKCGTPGYIDPSILRTGVCSSKLDVFSIGVVIYNLIYGKVMINGDSLEEVMDRNENFRHEKLELNMGSQDAKDLLWNLLNSDPEERVSVQQALESPWFDEFTYMIEMAKFINQNALTGIRIDELLPEKKDLCNMISFPFKLTDKITDIISGAKFTLNFNNTQ